MNNTGKIATGVLVGTILGAALGVLFAPKKGSETRGFIAVKARELGTAVDNKYEKTKDMLGISNGRKKELAVS